MQKLMFIDYLDGSRKVSEKDKELKLFQLYLTLYDCIEERTRDSFYLSKELFFQNHFQDDEKYKELYALLGFEQQGFTTQERLLDVFEIFLRMASENDVFRSFLYCFRRYKLDGSKNYLFSKYLANILQGTGVDVDCSFLHHPLSAYIEIPGLSDEEGGIVEGVLVSIKYSEGEWRIRTAYGCKPGTTVRFGHLYTSLPKGTTLSDSIATQTRKLYTQEGIQKVDSVYSSFMQTVINAVLYIIHSDSEQLERFNEFAQKKSKREGQHKVYTQKGFITMDFPNDIGVFSTFVKGHFRWQPHGEKRSKIKLIYIKPTTRNYRKRDEIILLNECLNSGKEVDSGVGPDESTSSLHGGVPSDPEVGRTADGNQELS